MKTQEILLASTLLAIVAGAGAALATRAFQTGRERESSRGSPAAERTAATADTPPPSGALLDDLRMENASLRERLSALEARVAELGSTRTPLVEPPSEAVARALELARRDEDGADLSELAFDDDFVASVGKAMSEIEAKEDADRELRRKELQAERVEKRVAELQAELGLDNRQASDMRTVFIDADDKREQLFDDLREIEGDPRDLRDSLRTLRDETHASLQGILTPAQYETFRQKDEAEGRRGFGEFGPPGSRPADGERRDGRPRR